MYILIGSIFRWCYGIFANAFRSGSDIHNVGVNRNEKNVVLVQAQIDSLLYYGYNNDFIGFEM